MALDTTAATVASSAPPTNTTRMVRGRVGNLHVQELPHGWLRLYWQSTHVDAAGVDWVTVFLNCVAAASAAHFAGRAARPKDGDTEAALTLPPPLKIMHDTSIRAVLHCAYLANAHPLLDHLPCAVARAALRRLYELVAPALARAGCGAGTQGCQGVIRIQGHNASALHTHLLLAIAVDKDVLIVAAPPTAAGRVLQVDCTDCEAAVQQLSQQLSL